MSLVFVDSHVQVPTEYVKNNEIVLNVGFEATSALKLGNEAIEFKARFGGASREIVVPVDHVIAIYARENGQGMAFPMPTEASAGSAGPGRRRDAFRRDAAAHDAACARPARLPATPKSEPPPDTPPPSPPPRRKPALKRVK
jgi:stringent starvation protein B